jgi:uncharacterized membrane protein YfcA
MELFGLPFSTVSVLWFGSFIGALAAGGAGFAFAVAASAIWLHVLEPLQTTTLVVACGTLLHVALVWPVRRSIALRRLGPFLVGAAVGVPLGVMLLMQMSPDPLKAGLGMGIIAYGAYTLLRPRLPLIVGGGYVADAGIGLIAGLLGGLGGYSGVLPAIWTQFRGWPKDIARGVYQPFILFCHLLTLILLGATALDGNGLLLFALALPPLAAGAWMGLKIYARLDEVQFKAVLAVTFIAAGMLILL